MRKVIKLLIVISTLYLLFNYLLGRNSDLIQYRINENFSIKETSNKDSVYFEIGINGIEFNFQIYEKLNKKAISKIEYYSGDEYKCILPIFKNNKIYTDIICLKNGVQYLYNTMNNNEEVTKFRNELGYFNDITNEDIKNFDLLTIYKNNLLEDKYIIINSYKGLYILSNGIQKEIPLFSKDIYNQTIKYLVGKFYVIADYNQNHDFSNFNIIDIETGKNNVLKTNYNFSYDSIIQGIYDNKLYLYDIESKIQYKIDIYKMVVEICGSEKKGIKIYNKELKIYNLKDIENFYFQYEETFNKYKLLNNYLQGNVYYYLLNNSIYKAYFNNPDKLTYLFTNNYDTIKYSKDYMCMLENDTLYCYDETIGVKKILQNKEFSFNKNLTYEVYAK